MSAKDGVHGRGGDAQSPADHVWPLAKLGPCAQDEARGAMRMQCFCVVGRPLTEIAQRDGLILDDRSEENAHGRIVGQVGKSLRYGLSAICALSTFFTGAGAPPRCVLTLMPRLG